MVSVDRTIVVVDDSPSDLMLAVAHLKQARETWTVVPIENPLAALDEIIRVAPDVIVSDLRMPGMDGLKLMEAVHQNYAAIPFVVITARGSEALAVKCLLHGAANYVPKSRLQDMLAETVEQVLGDVAAERYHPKLLSSIDATQFSFTLENDPTLIRPLVDLLQRLTYGMRLVNAVDRHRLGMALEEATLNAMYHGNLELPGGELPETRSQIQYGKLPPLMSKRALEPDFADRKVAVLFELTRKCVRIVVRDDGLGFHPSAVPNPHDPATLEGNKGRGLVLMANLVDELNYNAMGNEVTLIKWAHKTRR